MAWAEITIDKTTYERDQPKEIKKLQKRKAIRLYGKPLHDLYQRVYERDGGCCVKCGRSIPEGTPPHHIRHKSLGGEDTEENLEML